MAVMSLVSTMGFVWAKRSVSESVQELLVQLASPKMDEASSVAKSSCFEGPGAGSSIVMGSAVVGVLSVRTEEPLREGVGEGPVWMLMSISPG
jgi:hypothetical protein